MKIEDIKVSDVFYTNGDSKWVVTEVVFHEELLRGKTRKTREFKINSADMKEEITFYNTSMYNFNNMFSKNVNGSIDRKINLLNRKIKLLENNIANMKEEITTLKNMYHDEI